LNATCFFSQEEVGDAELKQQGPGVESSEEQENADETFKDSNCLLQEEAELRSALKHIMR
jgi:hypothetical protein